MPWTEVAPGRWERSLDTSEAFFWHLNNTAPKPPTRERWTMSAISTFKSNLSQEEIIDLLRPAWKFMRYMHPVIAATLEKDKKVYISPTPTELENWLDQTIVVEPNSTDIDSLLGEYKPTPLSILHYLPRTSEILFRSSHWRSDGVGLCNFTNSLFDALANPRDVVFGDEGKRLPPSLEEVVDICNITSEKRAKVQQKWSRVLETGLSLGVPIKPAIVPGGTYRKTHVLSERMTNKIVSACKDLGISVSSAIASSLVDVTQKRHPGPWQKKPKKFVAFPFINLRPYLPKSFNSDDNPFTVMIVNELLILDVKDFMDNAKQFAAFYSTDHAHGGSSDILSLASAWQEHNINLMHPPPPLPSPPKPMKSETGDSHVPRPKPQLQLTATPALNSLGVLDRYLNYRHEGQNKFEITDFWFGVEILGLNILVYAWTYRGRMRLTAYYNEAYYTGSYVQDVLEALMNSVLGHLGLSGAPEARL